MVKIYLGGPMAQGQRPDGRDHVPAARLEAFDRAEVWLRAKAVYWLPKVGLDRFDTIMVYNPATVYRTWPNRTREEAMRIDIRELTHCRLLLLLQGWDRSPGCWLETRAAAEFGIPTYTLIRRARGGFDFAKVELPQL
jgi:hypothetical protein